MSKPWWVHLVEWLTGWRCESCAALEIRFVREGYRGRPKRKREPQYDSFHADPFFARDLNQ